MRLGFLACLLASTFVACSDGSSKKGGDPNDVTAGEADAALDAEAAESRDAGRDAASDPDVDPDGGMDSGASSDDGSVDAARPMVCPDEAVTLSTADQVVLIVDGSQSMVDPIGETSLTRWDALREALFGADGVVHAFEHKLRIGLTISGSVPTCPLPLGMSAPVIGSAAALEAAFPALPPGIFTPTPQAIEMVAARFAAHAADTTLVVLTDGDPNGCTFDPAALPTSTWPETKLAILEARNAGFLVRVIGVGGGAELEELQRAANIGAGREPDAAGAPLGRGTDAATLRAAIAKVMEPRDVCRLHVDAALDPTSVCDGFVAIDGSEIECATDDGWWLESPHRIVLHGAACASLTAKPSAALSAGFPCATIDLPSGECRSPDDCSLGLTQCQDGACVECTDHDHCLAEELCEDNACTSPCGEPDPCTGATPYCDVITATCVACIADSTCPTGVCEPETKTCVGCLADEDCTGALSVCDTDARTCIDCQEKSDCSGTEECCDGTCIDVQGDDDRNCGGCGVVCDDVTSDRCSAGTCTCGFLSECAPPLQCYASLFSMCQ